jgi:hypothetical protein
MTTRLAIDDRLLEEAFQLGGHRTKAATIDEALKEYIQRRKQCAIFDLFGTIDYDSEVDYKKQRERG